MKKFLMAAFFGLGLFALSATSAFAVDCNPPAGTFPNVNGGVVNGPKPGCPCDAAQIQERQMQVKQVEGASYDKGITKQNDNSIGMTCFDHALKLTSKLGMIFSDIPTTGIFPAANQRVFGTVYDAAFGTGLNPITGEVKTLANSLDHVITDMMQSVADDFNDSLSAWLGATNLEFMSTFMDPINQLVAVILAPLAAIQAAITNIQNTMNTLITILDNLNMLFPSLAPNWINTIIMPIWNTIQTTLLQAVQTVQMQIMNLVVNTLTTFLNSLTSSLVGADPTTGRDPNDPAEGECSRIQRLWNPASITGQSWDGDFRPIEGGGTEIGTPYLNMMQLLTQNMPGTNAGMLYELTNAANSTVLQTALTEITTGALSGPGLTPSWPAVFGAITAGTGGAFPEIGASTFGALKAAF